MNLFETSAENPYHLSVGAVIRNADGKILCHNYGDLNINPFRPKNIYILMRESIEENETVEQALIRGAREEFGANVRPIRFIGSLVNSYSQFGAPIEKTTIYFLCDLIDIDESKRDNDEENQSLVEWKTPEFLIEKMEMQSAGIERTDLNEAEILKRII